MEIKTYVNETDEGFFLSFGSPILPNYEGPIITVTEEEAIDIMKVTAENILAILKQQS